MRYYMRAVLAAAIAAVTLAVCVTASSAVTFSIVGQTFKLKWSAVSFTAGGLTVRCPVTMEGSFTSSTFPVTARTRIGSASAATLGACTGGSATILRETLPWSVQYSSFAGSLPNITTLSLRLIGLSARAQPTSGPACLARTEEAEPAIYTAERERIGALTGGRLDETSTIRLTGEFLCSLAGRASLSGTSSIELATIPREEASVISVFETDNPTDFTVEQGGNPPPIGVKRMGGMPFAQPGITNADVRVMHIRAIGFIEPNTEQFQRVEAPQNRCIANMTNLGQNQGCPIQVKSESMTPVNVPGNLQITYTLGVAGPPLPATAALITTN